MQSNQGLSYFIDLLLGVVKSFIYDYQTSSVQIGTLGSAYYCSTLTASPTWIATGSSDIADSIIASKQCNKWSQQAFTTLSNGNMVDSSLANVYMSKSSSGGCFEVIGSLWTTSAVASIAQSTSPPSGQLNIPSLSITCTSDSCATESIFLTSSKAGFSFLVPSIPVTCITTSSCSTAPIMVGNSRTLTIPSQSTIYATATVDGNVGEIDTITLPDNAGIAGFNCPSRTISHIGNSDTIPAAYTSLSGSNYIFYIPESNVRRTAIDDIDSIYSTDPITVTNTYLTIPSYAVTCSSPGYACSDISTRTINDSAGYSVTIPSAGITCAARVCHTFSKTITITGTGIGIGSAPWDGDLVYFIAPQYVECDGSSCAIPKMIVYSGSLATANYATIPSLAVHTIGASAASLRGLCEDMLDS